MNIHKQQVSPASTSPIAELDNKHTPKERFRWPVIILGAALIPINSLWIARAEAMDYSGFPTCASLFYNVIFSLLILLLINTALRRFLPKIALCRRELLVVYAMLATGSSLVGHDYMQMLVPSIPHSAYFASGNDQMAKLMVPHLPSWLTITTPGETVTKFEQGHASLYRWEYIRPWIVPIAAWSTFLLAVIASMLSINVILRKHWVEEERLTYPIAQIPLLITEGGGGNSIFRSKLFWLGFGTAAALDIWNGLAQLYPGIPALPVKITDISYMFAGQRPWSAMGWTMVSFYPFVIGLSYFMPTNMAFSSWFFFFFRKAQQVFAASMGYEGTDAWYPYLKEQSYGGLIALFVATLWYGREHLKQVLTAVFTQTKDPGATGYKWALLVLAIGLLIMLGFLIIAGVTPWVAILYVLLYILFCGAFTRVRAELGPPARFRSFRVFAIT